MDSSTLPPNAPSLERWKFSGRDIARMIETGVLPDKANIELIHGELITMASEGPAHWDAKQKLITWFILNLPSTIRLAPDGPLRLADEEEPEPDFYLFAASMNVNNVRGADAPLVVEIADTSLERDKLVKAPLYAKYGVREYWIIDLANRVTLVHRAPSAGVYPEPQIVAFGDKLSVQAAPDLSLCLADVL